MPVVVDDGVALRWFSQSRPDKADTPAALAILTGHAQGRIARLQPPHVMAQVCAVLARAAPHVMLDTLQDLLDLSHSHP